MLHVEIQTYVRLKLPALIVDKHVYRVPECYVRNTLGRATLDG
jgi:hypothetical protein